MGGEGMKEYLQSIDILVGKAKKKKGLPGALTQLRRVAYITGAPFVRMLTMLLSVAEEWLL